MSEKQDKDAPPKGFRAALEQLQHNIDERIRAVLPNFSIFRELQQNVQKLTERVDALEKRLGEGGGPKE